MSLGVKVLERSIAGSGFTGPGWDLGCIAAALGTLLVGMRNCRDGSF